MRNGGAAGDWSEYLAAAGRKVRMADYHRQCAVQHAAAFKPPGEIPIPLQAHLEGVLYCADAAVDQVARALIKRCGLRDAQLRWNPSLRRVLELLDETLALSALKRWYEAPIVDHARRLRNLASHAYYTKSQRLEVQAVVDSTYGGSRAVDLYCCTLGEHLQCLPPLLDGLRLAD